MATLREQGLVTRAGGVIAIRDWERLAEVAEFNPAYLDLRCELRQAGEGQPDAPRAEVRAANLGANLG